MLIVFTLNLAIEPETISLIELIKTEQLFIKMRLSYCTLSLKTNIYMYIFEPSLLVWTLAHFRQTPFQSHSTELSCGCCMASML